MKRSDSERSVEDLPPEDRGRLVDAHRRLRESVEEYNRILDRGFETGEEAPVYSAEELARAQTTVERSEDELWRLREELLGWRRPLWGLRATLVADWFSEEDRVYDEIDPGVDSTRTTK